MYPHLSGIFLTFTSVHVSVKCRRLHSHEASATYPRQLLFLPHREQQHRVVHLADIHFRYSQANPVTVRVCKEQTGRGCEGKFECQIMDSHVEQDVLTFTHISQFLILVIMSMCSLSLTSSSSSHRPPLSQKLKEFSARRQFVMQDLNRTTCSSSVPCVLMHGNSTWACC